MGPPTLGRTNKIFTVRRGTPNGDTPPPTNYGTARRGSPAQKQGRPYGEMESEIDDIDPSATLIRTK